MKIRNEILVMAVLGTMLGFSSDSLAALSAVVNGSMCKGVDPANEAKIGYGQFGVHNTVVSAGNWARADVVCPFPNSPPGIPDPRYFTVTVYDRSSVYAVSCTLLRLGYDGNVVETGPTQQTPGSGWSWSPYQLSWALSAVYAGNNYIVTCSIPPIDSNVGANSHLTSIIGTTD
jgi:hypothetical protein